MSLYRGTYRMETARLPAWDYTAPAWYFVTLCTKVRVCHFGEVRGGDMRWSPAGAIVAEEWQKTPEVRSYVALDAWGVMPNHFHGLLGIRSDTPASPVNDGVDVHVETSRRDVSTGRDVSTVPAGRAIRRIKAAEEGFVNTGIVRSTHRRRMRLFIALVAWLGFSGLVYAQPEAGRGVWIGLGGGYTAIANKDVAASPLTYRGGAVPVALALRVQTRRSDHRLTLQGASTAFNAQGLAAHIETAAPDWNCLDLNYAWLRLLTAASSPLDIATGGGVSAYGFDRSYAYLDGVSWDALATLDARARIGRAFGRQAIGLEGGVSLLGYLHRPPYFLASEDLFAYVYDNEGSVLGLGRLYGPNRFFRGELRLEYVLHLGDRLDVVTAVRAMGYRIDVPERTATVQRDLTLLLRFKV